MMFRVGQIISGKVVMSEFPAAAPGGADPARFTRGATGRGEAFGESPSGPDARTAVALYAMVAAAVCGSWLLLYTHLRRRPVLLDPLAEPRYVRHGQLRSAAGIVAYGAAGLVGYFLTPLAGLAVFVVVPGFYF